jgi:hypothetical protein
MPKLNTQSSEKYGYNNMRSERIKNVGTPKFGNDAMPWAVPNYTTTLRDLIPNPVAGMLIFNTTTLKLNFYTGISWIAVTS